jgi:hypothetical protein
MGSIIDTLKETSLGNYSTSLLTGTPGHSYSLFVKTNSQIFKSSCTMPAAVSLDSLYLQRSPFGGNDYQIIPVYSDPASRGNFYHFAEIKNDSAIAEIYIRNDDLINGQKIAQTINGRGSPFNPGDRITIYLQCIDSAVYQYYYGLEQSTNQNSASPANPVSNITGGCLGYFSAYTSSYKTVTVQ